MIYIYIVVVYTNIVNLSTLGVAPRPSLGTLLWNTFVEHFCGTLLRNTFAGLPQLDVLVVGSLILMVGVQKIKGAVKLQHRTFNNPRRRQTTRNQSCHLQLAWVVGT